MPGASNSNLNEALRSLPAVSALLNEEKISRIARLFDKDLVTAVLRDELNVCREAIRKGITNGGASLNLVERCAQRLEQLSLPRITPAINATGIVIHTGMGRAPLAEEALRAIAEVGAGYCDVAISREHGGRRPRHTVVEELLRRLTGCEAAIVTNNNAAAVMLALATHARGREVIVSRGQLVEIGGSFRLPDVMTSAGAILREVGTTNRTRIADYRAAINDNTAAIMRIHPSNFRQIGFIESASLEEMSALAREKNLLLLDDIGSGALIDFAPYGLKGEPIARESIEAGADIVLFSGDKLLGGPQAGILAGRREAIASCAKHPMMRALRVDKTILAALEATLRLYLEPARLAERLPLLRMIAEPAERVRERAERLAEIIRKTNIGAMIEIIEDAAFVGGGSLPEESLPSFVVALTNLPLGAEAMKRRLRLGDPAVFARVRQDRLEFDMRTVFEREVNALASAIAKAAQSESA